MINEVFKFMENQVRIIGTTEDPLFCLKDVCNILELRVDVVVERLISNNSREGDDPLSKGVVSKQPFVDSKGRIQKMYFVNEDGLYDTILDSRKPIAKTFRKWLTKEVLPSIRKTGIYIDKDHDKIRSFGINVRLVEARAIKHLLAYAKENYNIELNRDENYGKLSCYANRISDMKQDARDEADSINLAICLTIESCIAVTINTLISLNIHPLDITKMTMHTLNKFVSKIKDESKKRKDKKKHKMSVTEVSNSIVLDYTKLARKHIFDNIEVA